MLTFTNQIGSASSTSDPLLLGGGRIILIADNVRFTGKNDKLTANGYPLLNHTSNKTLHGGSGGFIYVKVNHVNNISSVDSGSRITANGGDGKNGGNGGAGGVIVISKLTMTSEFVQAQPGKPSDNTLCKFGGPGSIFYPESNLLTINSNGTTTLKKTYINATASQLVFKNLELKAYSTVVLRNCVNLTVTTQMRTGYNSSLIVEGDNIPNFYLNFLFLANLD